MVSEKEFIYDLMEAGFTNEGRFKRFLVSIEEKDQNNNILPPYDLMYFSVNGTPVTEETLKGHIEKIVYPTGGFTTYTYTMMDQSSFKYESLYSFSTTNRGWPLGGDGNTLVFAKSANQILIRSWNGFRYEYADEIKTLPFTVNPGTEPYETDLQVRVFGDYIFVSPHWEYNVNDTKTLQIYRKTPNGWKAFASHTFGNIYDIQPVNENYVLVYEVPDVTQTAVISLWKLDAGNFVQENFSGGVNTLTITVKLEDLPQDPQGVSESKFGSLRALSPNNNHIVVKDGYRTYLLDKNNATNWVLRGPWDEYYYGNTRSQHSWSIANTTSERIVSGYLYDGNTWMQIPGFGGDASIPGAAWNPSCFKNQVYLTVNEDLLMRRYYTSSYSLDYMVKQNIRNINPPWPEYQEIYPSLEGKIIKASFRKWLEECNLNGGPPCPKYGSEIFIQRKRNNNFTYIGDEYSFGNSPYNISHSYYILNQNSILKLSKQDMAPGIPGKTIIDMQLKQFVHGTWGSFQSINAFSSFENYQFYFSPTSTHNPNWDPDLYRSEIPGPNFIGFTGMPGNENYRYFYTDPLESLVNNELTFAVPVVMEKKVNDGYSEIVYSYTYSDGVYRNHAQSLNFNKVEEAISGYGKTVYRYYNDLDDAENPAYPDLDDSNLGDSSTKKGWLLDGKLYQKTAYAEDGTTVIQSNDYLYYVKRMNSSEGNHIRLNQETTTLDGVSQSTDYTYNSRGQVSEKIEHLENSKQRRTLTKYAYEVGSGIYASMANENMLSQVYSTTITTESGDVESKTWTTWRSEQNTYVPEADWVWIGDGSDNDLTAPDDPGDTEPESRRTLTYDTYDNTGNILQTINAIGTSTAYHWAYNSSLLIAMVTNSTYTETLVEPCEIFRVVTNGELAEKGTVYSSGSGTLTLSKSTAAFRGYCQKVAVTGWSGTGAGFQLDMGNLDSNTDYIVEFDYKVTSGKLAMVTYTAGAGEVSTTYNVNNSWAHQRMQWNMGGNGNSARVYFRNDSGQPHTTFYVDNIRIYPADAQCISRTYDLLLHLPTISSDENGMNRYFDYDGFGRLIKAFDPDGNILVENSYYFSRDGNTGNFSPIDPNYYRSTSYPDGDPNGLSLTSTTFIDGLGRIRQTLVRNGAEDIISTVEYNSYGQIWKTWKPYIYTLTAHQYDPNFSTHAYDYYAPILPSQTNPYSEHKYSDDPVARITEVIPEGENPSSPNSFTTVYGSEIKNGILRRYAETTDESGNTQKTYYDKAGNEILHQQQGQGTQSAIQTLSASALADPIPGQESSDEDSKIFTVDFEQSVSWSCTTSVGSNPATASLNVYEDGVELAGVGCTGGGSGSGTFPAVPGKTYKIRAYAWTKGTFASATGSVTFENFDPVTLETQMAYDINGNRIQATPPKGSTYTTYYTYDPLGSVVKTQSPDAGVIYQRYDKAGNIRFSQNAQQAVDNEFTGYRYDAFGRLSEVGVASASQPWSATYPDIDADYFSATQWKEKYDYDNDFMNNGEYYSVGKLTRIQLNIDDDSNTDFTRLLRYDKFSNLIEERIYPEGLNEQRILYQYDRMNRLTSQQLVTDLSQPFTAWYDYDDAGRLSKIYAGLTNSKPATPVMTYTYNADGQVQQAQLSHHAQTIQTLDYLYTIRGWLDQINSQNSTSDAYWMDLNYFPNGNISKISTQVDGSFGGNPDGSLNGEDIYGYTFTYDGMNRLMTANAFGPGGFDTNGNAIYQYDNNGNILSLNRQTLAQPVQTHFYLTGTNRLDRAFNQSPGNYGYNASGSITSDASRGITNMVYNYQNLPVSLQKDGATVKYGYNNSGQRIYKKVGIGKERWYLRDAAGNTLAELNAKDTALQIDFTAPAGEGLRITIAGESQTYLSDGNPATATVEYSQQDIEAGISIKPTGSGAVHITSMNTSALSRVVYLNYLTPGGEILGQKYFEEVNNEEDHYFIKDHLGNIRVTIAEDGTVVASEDFYPYGKVLRGMNLGLGEEAAKYKFSGKERDIESGLDYFGARFYDSDIGRWWSVDPLASKYSNWTPYHFVLNNPIKHADLDGKDVVVKGGLLKSIVNEMYRKSATFRKVYNAQRANRNMVQTIRLRGGEPSRSFRAFTIFKSFTNDGTLKKQILTEVGSFETGKGAIAGHELQHGIEISSSDDIKTMSDYKKVVEELSKKGEGKILPSGHLETKAAKEIESKIIKELKDQSDDIKLPKDVDVTKQLFIDETHPPEEKQIKKEEEQIQD